MRQEPVTAPVRDGAFAPACLEAALDAAATAATRADPADALEGVLGALHRELDGAFVSAFVLEHGRLWLVGMFGYAMIPDGLDLAEGVMGRAVRSGQPQLVPDVGSDPDFIVSATGVSSEFAVPVSTDAGIVGVLNIETTRPLPAEAVDLVAPLTARLGPVLESIRIERTLDLSALARLFVYMGSLRDPTAIAEVTARSLARLVPLETCQVELSDESGTLAPAASWSAGRESLEPLPSSVIAALRAGIDPSAVFELVDVEALGSVELAGRGIGSLVLVPLRANGEEMGVLAGASRTARPYDHRQAEAAALLGAHAAASIDSALALSRERRSALTDPLTGLLNRRGFEATLESELEIAQQERRPLTLMVLDCDDFKEVNDRAGHEFGDELLREVGLVLAGLTERSGVAARLGGDEFVVMLIGLDVEEGTKEGDRLLRLLVSGLAESGFPVGLSAGLASYPYDGAGATQLLRAADQALYQVKASGKGRATAFRDVVRGTAAAPGRTVDRRLVGRSESVQLGELMETAAAIWAEPTALGVVERLAKSLPFVYGATGCVVSRAEGNRLVDIALHALRSADLGGEAAYLIEDFPLTREVLATGRPRAISFLDDDLDRAEAFVLREVKMSCCLLVPIPVHGSSWGLVEIYDQRLRRFTEQETAAAEFLVAHAGRRLEQLGDISTRRRRLPVFRLPSAQNLLGG